MAQSKTKNLSFILLNYTLNKQKIRMTDTFMSPVTCFAGLCQSHDVCKLVIEAAQSSLRSVAGEAMGTGKNGARGKPITVSSACYTGYFVPPQ